MAPVVGDEDERPLADLGAEFFQACGVDLESFVDRFKGPGEQEIGERDEKVIHIGGDFVKVAPKGLLDMVERHAALLGEFLKGILLVLPVEDFLDDRATPLGGDGREMLGFAPDIALAGGKKALPEGSKGGNESLKEFQDLRLDPVQIVLCRHEGILV
jgi:hypothetical protein